MKLFKVSKDVPGRLINSQDKTERPFLTRREFIFGREDIALDPVTVYNQSRTVIHEYGFVYGTPEQREKYVLIIPAQFVEMILPEDD